MKIPSWKRWWSVALNLALSAAFMVLVFVPCHRRAGEQSRRAAQMAQELEAKIALIQSLPRKQVDLQRVTSELSRFQASLAHTRDVDVVMAGFRSRAEEAGLELWILNPSVPVLIKLEAEGDSLSRLDLAVLPVTFEFRGAFLDVARFLETEEARPDFCRWISLSAAAYPQTRGLQAKGEIQLYLLPEPEAEAAAS